jgi:hypothetical protein
MELQPGKKRNKKTIAAIPGGMYCSDCFDILLHQA